MTGRARGRQRDNARDTTMVRRALLAGLLVGTAVGGPLFIAVAAGGGTGREGVAVVVLGLAAGGVVASCWLLVGTLLDLLANEPPGRWRVAWLIVVVAVTLLSPLLLAGATAG